MRSGQKSGGDCSNGSNGSNGNSKTVDANKDSAHNPDDCDVKMDAEQPNDAVESSALAECKMITSNQPKVVFDIDNALEMIEKSENGSQQSELSSAIKPDVQPKKSDTGSSSCNSKSNESNKRGFVAGPDATKPLQPKAKLLRQQRKSEKLLKLANSSSEMISTSLAELPTTKKTPKNIEKNLKALINEMPADGKYKLKVFFIRRI